MSKFRVPVTELLEVQVVYVVEAETADEAYEKAQNGDFIRGGREAGSNGYHYFGEVVQRDPDKNTERYEIEPDIILEPEKKS